MNALKSVSSTKAESKRDLAKAKTRHALLKSALQLYSLEGICGLSMNKIAKGAGIAQPSFYNHFDSLEVLQQVLSEQLKENYLSPMRIAWIDMLKDYAMLSKEGFNQHCQHCLTMIFDAAFQNIALFQRLIEDSLRFDSKVENKGLGSLIMEIREEWTKIFMQGLQSAECSFKVSEVHICVDIAAAQVHELILGCHQQRYSQQQAIEMLCKNFDGLFSSFFVKDKHRVEG
ncbi:TetR/AcrR family transcriptional regulator of autoinduction and epiphytic fitness [Psychrobacter luti]|uniref:TetR/AcrR family transcriptional regulator of autoinduction and epiphytic fitness n=1 Tax=Psychrobacter luti TaxID=198481 RepID=A0A839TB54_9GAMM|nr:TetR/AcrR family transcriptional regulator [Psychrobacter luti]MBB3106627.1 TetR/AcrR family transcriptional regulator of autoinduction and epiphytic fitness [Psychrobacter luti]